MCLNNIIQFSREGEEKNVKNYMNVNRIKNSVRINSESVSRRKCSNFPNQYDKKKKKKWCVMIDRRASRGTLSL